MYLLSCGVRIALDNDNGDVSFISHAHSDHLRGVRKKEMVLTSEETFALANIKGVRTEVDGARLVEAGHILGSKQLVIDGDGERAVYTGDVRIKESILFKGAEIVECDHLIIDGTYYDPAYRFPPYESVYEEIGRFVKTNERHNILIGCYDLGKAQEMIAIMNEFAGIAPIVNKRTEQFCSVYERFGIKLDRIEVGSEEAEETMQRPFVALVPMKYAKRYFARRLSEAFERKTLCAVTTGWALRYRYDVDAAFILSDHADFYDLNAYIEQSGAQKVELFDSNGKYLLNERSITAMATVV